jgi:HEAT repeat protein
MDPVARAALRAKLLAQDAIDTQPLLIDLAAAGINVTSLEEIRRGGNRYSAALPVLLRWLPRIDNYFVKESIVRCLTGPWAAGDQTATSLIKEFDHAPISEFNFRWAVGNAVEVIADASVVGDLLRISADRAQGRARQMFVQALAKVGSDQVVDLLISLLSDDEVVQHALYALGKLRAEKAIASIGVLQNDPRPSVRKEVKVALRRIAGSSR